MVAWMPTCPCQEVVRTCLTCTTYIISIDKFGTFFHPFPSISIHVRVCRRHSVRLQAILSFSTPFAPQNLVARFQLFSDASGPGPQVGQPLQFLKHKRGFERGELPGKNGGFMRCGDIDYYLGILGLQLGRFLGGKPLKSDTITPHNGSHTPAFNWNCDLKDDDEP